MTQLRYWRREHAHQDEIDGTSGRRSTAFEYAFAAVMLQPGVEMKGHVSYQ